MPIMFSGHLPAQAGHRLPGIASVAAAALLGLAALVPAPARAVDCGSHNGYTCNGSSDQYAGGFSPGVGHGGFGGGSCQASRTPVVFIHGNGDSAISFDMPPGAVSGYTTPGLSPYDSFKAAGYNDCELFGITWLTPSERASPQGNHHKPATYQMLKTFIDKVRAYTGKTQVDIVAHSLGSSMAMAMIQRHAAQDSVRRFINIAGGIRGLQTCRLTGYQSALAPTCNAEAYVFPYDHHTFGLYPSTGVSFYGNNRWTGTGSNSLRALPARWPGIRFYTLTAGLRDQVHCFTTSWAASCDAGALYAPAANVIAQLDVGVGSTAYLYDWDWADGSPLTLAGGDHNGVGHFRSLANTGTIQVRMLGTACSADCAGAYSPMNGPATLR